MKPMAFLSMMAGYIRWSVASLTPLKWLGMAINFFISLKYLAFISSIGGLYCSFFCLGVIRYVLIYEENFDNVRPRKRGTLSLKHIKLRGCLFILNVFIFSVVINTYIYRLPVSRCWL